MKNCHECDSEVADNDIFCPYCGISIQGVAVDAASDDDAFSSTIVISASVPVPEPAEVEQAVADTKIFEPPAAVPCDDKNPDEVEIGDQNEGIDKTIETSFPINGLDEPVEISATEPSIDVDTPPQDDLSKIPPVSEMAGEDESVDSNPPEDPVVEVSPIIDVVEEPRLAERLTGAIGPIPDADDEGRQIEENGEVSTSVSYESVEDDPEQVPTVEDIDFSTSDVPTPILLSSDEVEFTVDKLGEAALDAGEIDISMPADVPDAEETVNDEYHPENAVIPDVVDAVSEPVAGLESAVEPEIFDGPERESLTEDPIDEPEPAAFLMADGDQILPPQTQSVGQADEPEPDVPVSDEPLRPPAADSANEVENGETRVPVTDEPLQHAVANTGDGLGDAETNGGTTPNIGSTDTDGRKSGLKPLAEGTVLNSRYDILRKIGGGGMGAVYLASDRNLGGVQRAVKEMVQSHIEEEQQEKAVEDFKRESTILSTLDHPSIPTIYDYFFDAQEGRFYLVMKYISGGDLAGKLRATPEGRIDERTVCEWALQIIDVLDYLHNLPTKIVYRDLKPSNVMIDGNSGRIMLIDFGIARSINQNQEKGVTAVGTMGYAPPELFSGNVEPRSDIYSLGSTMFHLLTGADPQNNPLLIFDFQKNPRPRQINPQLSDQIERVLMRSVEYNADARFESAAEMKHALASHIDNLKTGQITYGVTEVPQSVSLSHQIVFCGFCGQRIVATDMFCAFCGSKQPLAQHGVHSEVYSQSVGTARLVIEGTSDLTAPAYGLEKNENLVGRRDPMSNIFPEVDLSKYDPQTKISRRHAKIWRDGNNYLVEDLGSSNGTLLLPQIRDTMRLLPHQPHPLASGDRIRIGDTTLQFIVG